MKPISEWQVYFQTLINNALTAAGFTNFDFLPGSVMDTLTLIWAYMANYVQGAVWYFKDQAWIHTADLPYLKRKALDFNVTVDEGTKATGEVTFSRTVTTGSVTVVIGTQIMCSPEFYSGIIFVTTEEGIMGNGVGSVTVDVEAIAVGEKYNVEPGTIRHIVVPIVGVDAVTNNSATSGGTDGDDTLSLRDKLESEIQNLSRATLTAVEYRAKTVTGVNSVHIEERPTGEVIYDETDPDVVYTGTWSNLTSVYYLYGGAKTTSTPNDYVEFTFQNEGSVIPVFVGEASESICQIYIDGVSQGTYNTQSAQASFDGDTYTTTTAKHVIKIKLISGSLTIDGFKCSNTAHRDAVLNVFIDDGSGTASWTLLALVRTELENWRAAGIRYFIRRCELDTLDLTIYVKWLSSANKDLCKMQITSDLSEYLTTIKAGGTIYINNLYAFVNYQDVKGQTQVETSIITVPAANTVLDHDTIVRIGTVTFLEL